MSKKYFCDDCKLEIKNNEVIKLWIFASHPLRDREFCFICFSKHWKPLKKKFSLKDVKVPVS